MSITTELMDRAKKFRGLASDAALGRLLGKGASTMSNYRQGMRHAEPEIVTALAGILGEDPEVWVLRVQAEREIIPARKQVWLRAAERLASFAAVAAFVFLTTTGNSRASQIDVQKSSRLFAESAANVYYVK